MTNLIYFPSFLYLLQTCSLFNFLGLFNSFWSFSSSSFCNLASGKFSSPSFPTTLDFLVCLNKTRNVVWCKWIVALDSTNKIFSTNPSIFSRIRVLSVGCCNPFVRTFQINRKSIKLYYTLCSINFIATHSTAVLIVRDIIPFQNFSYCFVMS